MSKECIKPRKKRKKKEKNKERQNRKKRRGGRESIWGKQENVKIT
jgi:hypothetical protein